jgi:hypothetical protein
MDDFTKNIYIVEGPVVEDPCSGRLSVRAVDQEGKSFDFDPQSALLHFKGQEVRLVVVPLLTIKQLEEMQEKLGESP